MKHEESKIQEHVVIWLEGNYPNCLFTCSIAGVNLPIQTASRMKKMGYRRGTPDLFILEPRGTFHALFLEVKAEKGKPTKDQLIIQEELMKRGYLCLVEVGYQNSVDRIKEYLSLPKWP